jgi:hypothetical protein
MITLPIFWNNKDTALLEDLGIEIDNDLTKKETKDLDFYEIIALTDYLEEGKYTCVITGAGEFICNLPRETVRELIKKSKKYE